jgi:hypothetical protein
MCFFDSIDLKFMELYVGMDRKRHQMAIDIPMQRKQRLGKLDGGFAGDQVALLSILRS